MKPKQQIYSLPHLTTLEPSQKISTVYKYSVRESNSPLENENLLS